MKKALLLSAVVAAFGIAPTASARHRHFWGGVYVDPFWGPPPMFWYEGAPNRGAIDTDVQPEDAHVIVDGKDVGEADDFDGMPRYLVLRPGKHRVEFRHKGYDTLVVEVQVKPGWLFRIDDRLDRGSPDKKVFRKSGLPPAPRRSYDHDDDDDEDRPRRGHAIEDPDDSGDAMDDDAYEEDDVQGHDEDAEADEHSGLAPAPGATGRASIDRGRTARDQGTVRFRIAPADSSVYVDGEYVGNARDIGRTGLRLAPGDHTVVVTREGYDDRHIEISVDGGTTSEVNVDLPRSRAS